MLSFFFIKHYCFARFSVTKPKYRTYTIKMSTIMIWYFFHIAHPYFREQFREHFREHFVKYFERICKRVFSKIFKEYFVKYLTLRKGKVLSLLKSFGRRSDRKRSAVRFSTEPLTPLCISAVSKPGSYFDSSSDVRVMFNNRKSFKKDRSFCSDPDCGRL